MEVFISYSSQDRFFCELLELKLDKEGVKVWRDVRSLAAGSEWRASIDTGIDTADVIILVLSKASCASHYVTYEWSRAIGRDKPIFPILLEACERHPKIEPIQYIDFVKHSDATWSRVVARVKEMASEAETSKDADQERPVQPKNQLDPAQKRARDKIIAYLNGRGFRMVSFERIRLSIDKDLSDEFLQNLASQSEELALAYLKGPKTGIKLR